MIPIERAKGAAPSALLTLWTLLLAALVLLLAASPSLGADTRASFLPQVGSYELPPIATVRDRILRNPEGEPEWWLGLQPGQLAVVSLVYTGCPDACPLATSILQQLDAELAKRPAMRSRVRLVTTSFDPTRDKPAQMLAYRDALQPKSDWSFLTAASPEEIQPVLDDLGQDVKALIGPDGQETALLGHVLRVYLIDHHRAIRNIYSSGFLSKEILLLDLETLMLDPELMQDVAP